MILGKVGRDFADAELVRPFFKNNHPGHRLEALNAGVILKPGDIEDIVIELIKDPVLSKIGSDLSVSFLKDMAHAHPGLSDNARKAAENITTQP